MTADVDVEILFTSNVQDKDTLKDHRFKSISKEIHAASEVEAKVKYADEVHQDYVDSKMYERGDTKILNIHYTSIVNASELEETKTEDIMMKQAKPINYTFMRDISDVHDQNEGFCVLILFLGYINHILKN